jgi:hypothetical protein
MNGGCALLVRQWARAKADNEYFRMQSLYAKGPDFSSSRNTTLQELQALQEFRSPGDDQLRGAVQAAGTMDWCRAQLCYIGLQVVIISLATIAFFLWNHLSGVFGPA